MCVCVCVCVCARACACACVLLMIWPLSRMSFHSVVYRKKLSCYQLVIIRLIVHATAVYMLMSEILFLSHPTYVESWKRATFVLLCAISNTSRAHIRTYIYIHRNKLGFPIRYMDSDWTLVFLCWDCLWADFQSYGLLCRVGYSHQCHRCGVEKGLHNAPPPLIYSLMGIWLFIPSYIWIFVGIRMS